MGALVWLTSRRLERSRDFAIFKAFGTADRDLVETLLVWLSERVLHLGAVAAAPT